MLIYNAEETSSYASRALRHPFKDGQIFDENSKREIYQKLLLGEVPNSVCLKAIRSECAYFPQHFMDYRVINGEDLMLTACFLTNCKKIACINDGLYYYRTRPGSAVNSFNLGRKQSIKIVHTELGKYVDRWGMPELKPLHNARKVRGWVYNLKLLIQNRKKLDRLAYRRELKSMATDTYFRSAYITMDKDLLSRRDRLLAFCLYHRLLG
jgi:hypothetical protein